MSDYKKPGFWDIAALSALAGLVAGPVYLIVLWRAGELATIEDWVMSLVAIAVTPLLFAAIVMAGQK